MSLQVHIIGFTSAGIPNLTPREAFHYCCNGAVLVDLRPEFMRAYKQFDVKKVVYAESESVRRIIKQHPKDQVFVFAESSSSEKSSPIIKEMINQNYKSVYNLAGGFIEWERDGFPIIEDKYERLTGSCMCQLKPRKKRTFNRETEG